MRTADTPTGPAPGPPPPCGVEKVLCKLKCMTSKPRSPGRDDAGEGVHVGAVAVDEAAAPVNQPHHLLDALFEQAKRIGVRDHDAGDGVIAGGPHRLEIDVAAGVGRNLDRDEAGHGRRGRVGAVRGVRNQNARAFGVAALAMIGAHHQEAGKFALRARGRLQRHCGKAADLGKPLLQLVHQREIALHGVRVLQRMGFGEGRQAGDLLVDLRVVFHGAGAERIEPGIDPEIALGERKVMSHDIDLRQFRQLAIRAQFVGRELSLWHVGRRQVDAVPAGHAQFVDGRNCGVNHRATSPSARTSRSMLARGFISVTATSMCCAKCG